MFLQEQIGKESQSGIIRRRGISKDSRLREIRAMENEPSFCNLKSSAYTADQTPIIFSRIPIQAKLTIGQPNDKYEREADRMADRVMEMPESKMGSISSGDDKIQRKCAECEKDEEEEKIQMKPLASQVTPFGQRPLEMVDEGENMVQTKAEGGVPAVAPSFQSRLNISEGGGSPLPKTTNQFMSNAFGTDFNHVRIHNDSGADQMNKDVHAKAFTHGSDIYFKSGQYSPESSEGKRLLAHELTHVVQQSITGNISHIQRQTAVRSTSCPTLISLTIRSQTPSINNCRNRCRIGIGCCTTPRGHCGTTRTGAVFEGRIRAPQGCTGELAFMQNIITTNRRRTLSNGTQECMASNRVLKDGGIPWKGCTVTVNSSGNHTITSDDCPFIRLRDNMNFASANDSFKTFLLWKPTGSRTRRSIANVIWGWSATARRLANATGNCTNQWTISNPSKTNGNGSASSTQPVTSPSVQSLRWSPCSTP